MLSDESKLCKQCHSHKIIEIENENATKHDNIPFKTIRFCRDRFPFDSNEWCDICLSEECTNCHKTFVFMHDSCDVLCQACDDFLNNDIIGEHVSSNEQSVALQLFYLFKNYLFINKKSNSFFDYLIPFLPAQYPFFRMVF